jgi:hypothetical protein
LSTMGMKMTREMGFRFVITSLGTPLRVMVAACEVKLLFIWLYESPTMVVSFRLDPMRKRETHSIAGST